MFDPDIIRRINLGRCFALIGAGPSAEIGYPSWRKLAERAINWVLQNIEGADSASYDRFFKQENYPAVFSQVEHDVGGRESLVRVVKEAMEVAPGEYMLMVSIEDV